MKKKYEKPVTEVIRMDDTMQMICSSGFKNETGFKVNKWERLEETNAEGTSTEIEEKDLPQWLKDS